jgi:hypothetical protein
MTTVFLQNWRVSDFPLVEFCCLGAPEEHKIAYARIFALPDRSQKQLSLHSGSIMSQIVARPIWHDLLPVSPSRPSSTNHGDEKNNEPENDNEADKANEHAGRCEYRGMPVPRVADLIR